MITMVTMLRNSPRPMMMLQKAKMMPVMRAMMNTTVSKVMMTVMLMLGVAVTASADE